MYTLLAQSIPLDGQYFVSMRFRALLSPRGGPRAPPLALVARGGVKTKRVRALYDFWAGVVYPRTTKSQLPRLGVAPLHFPAYSLVSKCSVGTPGPRWEVFWWVARDLDFYGWVMYKLHAAARTQHTTPSFMGFWPVPDALESFRCLLVPILPLQAAVWCTLPVGLQNGLWAKPPQKSTPRAPDFLLPKRNFRILSPQNGLRDHKHDVYR